ncbi:hypothetical protein D3C81_208830 [compost metagenome]
MVDRVRSLVGDLFKKISHQEDSPVTEFPTLNVSALLPVTDWSHPFRQKGFVNILHQLTQQGRATAGFYPLGVSGLWHGGIHFDSGTAAVLDQTSVSCIADGEVIAYRIDMETKETAYVVKGSSENRPFSRNFVLVRHRVDAPEIAESSESPPSLIFYSLYMHLQDGAFYRDSPFMERPAFWEERGDYIVSKNAKDKRSNAQPTELGSNIRHLEIAGSKIDFLPQGSHVRISGDGDFRKLESSVGPSSLRDESDVLQGYVEVKQLDAVGAGEYSTRNAVNVYSEADRKSKVLSLKLPKGTLVKVSGEGEFRRLLNVAQFVYFKSLEVQRVPCEYDNVSILATPVPISAGDLVGHVGVYQDAVADRPEKKLHLEVFSADDVAGFFESCREWSKGLPGELNTWLELARGTEVVPDQGFTKNNPPAQTGKHPVSAENLLVPKSLLDGLPPTHRIKVPAAGGRRACNWYHLEGVLSDAANQLLNGWVKEEVGITPWKNPWDWEGYQVITEYKTPAEFMAASRRSEKLLTEEQLKRFGAMADEGEKSTVKTRLRELVDSDGNGRITANELRAAIQTPAGAQKLSKLVVSYESEWYYAAHKWDALDELLGHSGSTPNVNWLAEKDRIKQLSWWGDVAAKLWLPQEARVYHFNPMGLLANLGLVDDNDLRWLVVPRGQFTFDAEGNDIEGNASFTRIAHAPPGESGITIGRGYDLGQRSNSENELPAVGIGEPLLSWLVKSKKFKGEAAREYYRNAPKAVREYKITRRQQFELFVSVYDFMISEVVRISRNNEAYGVLNWEALDPRVRDVVVDLIYRGDYHPDSRKFVQRPFVNNDVSALRAIMMDRDKWGASLLIGLGEGRII